MDKEIASTISAGAAFLLTVGGPALVFIFLIIIANGIAEWFQGWWRNGGKK